MFIFLKQMQIPYLDQTINLLKLKTYLNLDNMPVQKPSLFGDLNEVLKKSEFCDLIENFLR